MAPFGVGGILVGLCGWGGAGLFPHISMHWGWMWCLLPSQPNEGPAIWTASPKLNGLGCSGQPTRTWLPASPAQQAQGWQRPRHPVVLPTGSLWDATQLLPCPTNKADLPTRVSRPGGDAAGNTQTLLVLRASSVATAGAGELGDAVHHYALRPRCPELWQGSIPPAQLFPPHLPCSCCFPLHGQLCFHLGALC